MLTSQIYQGCFFDLGESSQNPHQAGSHGLSVIQRDSRSKAGSEAGKTQNGAL